MWFRLLVILGAFATACASNDPLGVAPPGGAPRHARVGTPSGLTIHAIRTGWVAVKEPHWRHAPPGLLVLPRIFLSRRWHPWVPNISYVLETPAGVIVVDTGSSPDITQPAYMACDPRSRFFYATNLRFVAPRDDVIGRQLDGLGIAPERVSTIVITHFHGDHHGNLAAFPAARVLTGHGNWPSHVGLVRCTLPADFAPVLADMADGPFGVFGASQRLLGVDDVRLVPLPGHTPGHVGVLVRAAPRWWLIAGDATFDAGETAAGHVAGVSEDVEQARATQRLIARQLAEHDTVLLPAHDPTVFERLAASVTGVSQTSRPVRGSVKPTSERHAKEGA